MSELAIIDQDRIAVKVEYYDDNEKKKLSVYPTADEIERIISGGLDVPTSEFLTYYLFHRKRPGMAGWRNYDEVSRKVHRALIDLKDFVGFNGNSIFVPPAVNSQVRHITEQIGESVGLSVVNRLHDLTAADWTRIPELRGREAPPVFDYEIAASDGKDIVQVETKGSSVDDNRRKSGPIHTHKAKIAQKKSKIIARVLEDKYPFKADVRYGTITAIDRRQDGILKCWLVDPDPNHKKTNPKKLRLLNRISFLRDWISFLGPRSALAATISTRLVALESLANPFELDGVPLRRGNNEPFEIIPFDMTGRHSTWLANKSRVTDGPAGGSLLQLSEGWLFFLGIREDLLVLASSQDFRKILEYRATVGQMTKIIRCVLSESRFHKFRLPEEISESARKVGNYYHFDLEGQIHYSQEGIVFGLLSLGASSEL